jgi:signal transduction histidine kinase
MGIGLSMARSIVQLHSGRLWAENNREGKGTTFRFILPVDVNAVATTPPSPPAVQVAGECLVAKA